MTVKRKKTETERTALEVFERLAGSHENCFLLETLEDKDQPHTSSRSYIGVDPVRVFTARDRALFVDGKKQVAGSPFAALRNYLLAMETTDEKGYRGGLVGYFSHESVQYFEPSLKFDYKRNFPDFQLGEYRDGLVFAPGVKPEYFYYDEDRSELYRSEKNVKGPTSHRSRAALRIGFERAGKTRAGYDQMVRKACRDIADGRAFQVVLANRYEYSFSGDLLELYRELRRINPSPFMFFIKFGDFVTLGASPELLVHTKPNREIYLEALAGTIRRGRDAAEDRRLREHLLSDEKETAEHAMLVDLARNDAGRVSRIGSVEIERLMTVKKLSHVQHICSIIKGTLTEDKDAFDALAAVFQAGTLSGAPKIEAIKMIAELEGVERGPYGGCIGYFGYGGESMFAMNLRSLSAAGSKLFVHSGSGIVYDSRPESEFEEISRKKAAMDEAMKEFLK